MLLSERVDSYFDKTFEETKITPVKKYKSEYQEKVHRNGRQHIYCQKCSRDIITSIKYWNSGGEITCLYCRSKWTKYTIYERKQEIPITPAEPFKSNIDFIRLLQQTSKISNETIPISGTDTDKEIQEKVIKIWAERAI